MPINYDVPAFWILLKNGPYEFYDRTGRTIHNLNKAVEEANDQYGNNWREVYNGQERRLNINFGKCFVSKLELSQQ